MPQYMLSVWHNPENPIPDDPEVMQKAFKQVDAFNADIMAKGQWVFGGGLHGPESARTAWETLTAANYQILRMEPGYPPVSALADLNWKAYIVAIPNNH